MSTINVHACAPHEAARILTKTVRMAPAIRPTVMIHGEPGSGKSSIVKQVARQLFDTDPIDVRLATHEPTDIKGLPDIDREANEIRWIKPDFLPRYGEGILFLDELTQARRDTMAAIYAIVLDRRIDDLTIPPGYAIVAAGNDVADGAIANTLGTALADRMLHLLVKATPESFILYWQQRGMHPAILTLIKQMPFLLSDNRRRIEDDLMCLGTPRSWERAHNMLQAFDLGEMPSRDEIRDLKIVLSGCVGTEAAGHLELTMQDMNECASPQEILAARGASLRAKLPKTLRGAIALAFALGHICQSAEDIVRGCRAMAMLGEIGASKTLKATDNGATMSGRELAALGIERLLRNAESNSLVDDVLTTPRDGQKALLAYLDDVGERQQQTIARLRAEAA